MSITPNIPREIDLSSREALTGVTLRKVHHEEVDSFLLETCDPDEFQAIKREINNPTTQILGHWIQQGCWTQVLETCEKIENAHLLILAAHKAELIYSRDVSTAFRFMTGVMHADNTPDFHWFVEKIENEAIPENQRYNLIFKKGIPKRFGSYYIPDDCLQAMTGDIKAWGVPSFSSKMHKFKQEMHITKEKECPIYKISNVENMLDRGAKRLSDFALIAPGKTERIHNYVSTIFYAQDHDSRHMQYRDMLEDTNKNVAYSLARKTYQCSQELKPIQCRMEDLDKPYIASNATLDDQCHFLLDLSTSLVLDGHAWNFDCTRVDENSMRVLFNSVLNQYGSLPVRQDCHPVDVLLKLDPKLADLTIKVLIKHGFLNKPTETSNYLFNWISQLVERE